MYQVVGIERINYTNREGREVNGTRIHCTYDNPDKILGYGVEQFYIGSSIPTIGLDVGCNCEVLYNKYGKVAQVIIL